MKNTGMRYPSRRKNQLHLPTGVQNISKDDSSVKTDIQWN